MTSQSDRPIGPEVSTTPAKVPSRTVLKGRLVDLEPISVEHIESLIECIGGENDSYLWDYMPVGPFSDQEELRQYIKQCTISKDPLFYAIIDKSAGKAIGYASYLRIDPVNRTIETGHIMFSPELQQTTGATETAYLLAKNAFDNLGYRRYEWKCNDLNSPSKRAAQRLGFTFEGVFRQHIIVKGRNRDTAWFSIIDSEWPVINKAFEQWLNPDNFDSEGNQLKKLADFR